MALTGRSLDCVTKESIGFIINSSYGAAASSLMQPDPGIR